MLKKLLALGLLAAAASPVLAEPVLLGASKPGHSAYNIVVAYSQAIQKEGAGIETSVQASGSSIDAVQFMQTNRIHAAPMGASAALASYKGTGKFEGKPFAEMRTWLPMYSWGAQLVVQADSEIQSWSDLKGKRVGVGPVGSAGEGYNRDILAAIGLTFDDIEEYRVPHGEAIEGLKTGLMDAVIETTGFPSPGIMEVMASTDVRIIPNTANELKKIEESSPLYSAGKIPGGVYDGMDDDIPLVVGYTIMAIRSDVDDDAVYEMTKAIWSNLEDLKSAHASQALLSPEMIAPALMPIAPIHDGALRYYREQGWIE